MNSGEDRAIPMVSSSSSASNKYEGSVRDVGLITCGRTVYCQRARLLSWRSHMERGVQVTVQVDVGIEEQGEGETHQESKRRNEEQTLNRSSWMA